ncbi:MAG: 30S ribosomal protein S12 methylthiotransferase RimO [Deltaproteobacteria bacterium]
MAKKKVFMLQLGCAKNQVDGELMLGGAAAAGYEQVADAGDAEVLVVNTCAFIDEAKRESLDRIFELAAIKGDKPGCRLVVTGCMAERYSEALAQEIPEIDCLVGTGAVGQFASVLDGLEDGPGGATRIIKAGKHYLPTAAAERIVSDVDGSAYIKVSEGCDHECSFCVIPAIRGRHESRPIEDVAAEAEALAARGIVEVNLVAQDLSAYGRDLGLKQGLAGLLYRLGRIEGLERIRCLYLYPNTLSDESLDAIAAVDAVCPYIDIPLQHADGAVLRSMRRAANNRQLRRLLERIRARVDGAVLRTSFIVGFPGETESAFDTLCSFVQEMAFQNVAVFRYSPEEGSPAASLPGRVPYGEACRRRDHLMALQESVSERVLAARVGQRQRILVGGCEEDGSWYGRTWFQAPEIDGLTWLGTASPGPAGSMVDAEVTGSSIHDLYAEVLDPATASSIDAAPRHD